MTRKLRLSATCFCLGAALALALLASCEGSDENLVEGGARPDACRDSPGLCGDPCTDDSDCPPGAHCGSEDVCTAQCATDEDCLQDQHCDSLGQCSDGPLIDPDAVTGAGGAPNDDEEVCADVSLELTRQTPTVVLLIDQSGSMDDPFQGMTRWEGVESALFDSDDGVVASLEDEVLFGLALYTSDGGDEGGECPILTEVEVALGNYDEIRAVFEDNGPRGDTPTGDSIDALMEWFADYEAPGPKIIVLATDGEPDTCEIPNPNDPDRNPDGRIEALAATERAYDAGVETFVISVGDEVGEDHLIELANVGRGLSPSASEPGVQPYQADNAEELAEHFRTIVGSVRTCVFDLNGEVQEGQEDQGTVTLDGEPLEYQDPDGWELPAPDQIELVGDACTTILDGDHTLEVVFPCESVILPVE